MCKETFGFSGVLLNCFIIIKYMISVKLLSNFPGGKERYINQLDK